jgi:hypothetical protein
MLVLVFFGKKLKFTFFDQMKKKDDEKIEFLPAASFSALKSDIYC